MEKVIAIVGPTAVGKTGVSIEVAKRLQSEIISADSMQVYRYMDIGTAKVTKEEMQGIPHHMLDVVLPIETYSVANYQSNARKLITSINQKGKIPLLVGGTGLYINAVLDNYNFSVIPADLSLRESYKAMACEKGSDYLYTQLQGIDPQAAKRIHSNDLRRIIRALEVYTLTGKQLTQWEKEQNTQTTQTPYQKFVVGLTMPRDKLYERINQRVDQMFEEGLLEEVKSLLDMEMSVVAKQALGYKEIIDYFKGLSSLSEAKYIIKRETRRYAKRQLTWFKRMSNIWWIDWNDVECTSEIVVKIIDNIEGFFKIN